MYAIKSISALIGFSLSFLPSVCMDREFLEKFSSENSQCPSSQEKLISEVIEKARTILSENPRFNNRDLIREFFLRNSHYSAPMQTHEYSDTAKPSVQKKVAILGAGPSGLIAALSLAQDGHTVCVYEKRVKEQFAQRWQNVSINVPQLVQSEFPTLDAFLKEQKLIQYEMELDNPKKLRSYRIAIGDFQNALAHVCQTAGVNITYGESPQLEEIHDAQVILLSTGANTLEQSQNFKFLEKFNFKSFPEYKTNGVAALYYAPETDLPQGLVKERLSGEDLKWGFKVTLVGDGAQSQADRLAKIKPDKKFTAIPKNPALYWYLFATKKDKPKELPFSDPIDAFSFVDFIPACATQGAIPYQGKPLVLWGDARISPNPLTGAALTIPFLSAKALLQLVRNFDADSLSIEKYNQQTEPLIREVFIKTVLVTLFQLP
jgi:hypothetical protein